MKIRPVGFELFHVDGQTDRQTADSRDEANIRFFAVFITCLKTGLVIQFSC
jgi:hypothetical protein